jgi:hypothetical protein
VFPPRIPLAEGFGESIRFGWDLNIAVNPIPDALERFIEWRDALRWLSAP